MIGWVFIFLNQVLVLKRQKYAPGSSDSLQHKDKSEKLYESARVEERGEQTRNAMWVK